MSNYNVEISADNTITIGLPSTGNGVAGPRGEKGYSAYEVAIKNGYTGTEAEWLATLKGEKGEKGEPGVNGIDGKPGTTGLSAYELAAKNGFSGNESAWLASLKGDKGDQGPKGDEGQNGANGADGKDGLSAYAIAVKNGYNGTESDWVNKWLRGTIVSADVDDSGVMSMTDINGNVINTTLAPIAKATSSASAAEASAQTAATSATNAANSAKAAANSATAAANSAREQQADWAVTDATSQAYIQNKPDVLLKSGGTATGTIIAPAFETGNDALHYFQCRKIRGLGNADNYLHAIDLGYTSHNKVDFYEFGGTWNFYQCQTGRVENSKLVGSITTGQGWNGLVQGQDITTYAKKSDLSSSLSTTSLTVTGETSVPTANEGNSSNTIASTEFVAKSLAKMVDSAPESLNTLNELAKALGNDPNFATTVLNELAKKMNSVEAESTFAKKEEAGVLSGTIMAFSGTFKDGFPIDKNTGLVNKEWHLCDGTNGTPDLRSRFIYGGDGGNNGTTGGEESVTLSMEQIPKHHFSGTTDTSGEHKHSFSSARDTSLTDRTTTKFEITDDFSRTRSRLKNDYTENAGEHEHTFTTNTLGGNQPHNNMPPYYVLAFMMKL